MTCPQCNGQCHDDERGKPCRLCAGQGEVRICGGCQSMVPADGECEWCEVPHD